MKTVQTFFCAILAPTCKRTQRSTLVVCLERTKLCSLLILVQWAKLNSRSPFVLNSEVKTLQLVLPIKIAYYVVEVYIV